MAVSIHDVARRAGVSAGTVSNVMNRSRRVSDDVIARVEAAVVELGYVRNDAGRQLRVGRSTTIGLIVLDVRNPFFTDVARGAEVAAGRHGLSLLLGNSDESSAREDTYLALFEEQRVHGLLISPYGDVGDRLERLRMRGTPAVLVDRMSEDRRLSSVSVDDVAGGRMAVEHLLERGRKRIGFVGGSFEIRQVADRHAGADQAVSAAGAGLEVLETSALTVDEGRRIGEQLLDRPAGERPDALFAANDLVALGLLQALVVNDTLLVPNAIALIGFDDIDFAAAAAVPLSSIRQPRQLIGETAVGILVDEAADPTLAPRQVVFQPELVVRTSTGA